MDKELGILILLAEMFLIMQCLQISFKQRVRFDKYTLGIIAADICIYMGINCGMVPMIVSGLFYLLLWIYCHKAFQVKAGKALTGVIIGLSMAGCIELVMAYVVKRFAYVKDEKYELLLAVFLALVLTGILKNKLYLMEYITRTIKLSGLVVLYGLALAGLLINYYVNRMLIDLHAVAILFFVVCIFFYLHRLEQAQKEVDKKNYELELQRIYGDTYEKLLTQVRQRQHDFKNQLGAIYSMHLTARSLEELVEEQQKYGNILNENCKYDSILTGCGNRIMAGYLYYRCMECEQRDIQVLFDVCVGEAACKWAIHEVIEVLGILIDNACESVGTEPCADKCIKLFVQEKEDRIIMKVSNPSEYISFSEIHKMFEYGYSSKGENRGIGLAGVLELVKKYKDELKVANQLIDYENWIEFTIEMKK